MWHGSHAHHPNLKLRAVRVSRETGQCEDLNTGCILNSVGKYLRVMVRRSFFKKVGGTAVVTEVVCDELDGHSDFFDLKKKTKLDFYFTCISVLPVCV